MTDPERSVFPEGWTVRPAGAADTPQLAALEVEARAALVDARGGAALLAEQPAVDDWAALLADGLHHVWVATIDDVVVGYLQLRHADGEPTGVVVQVYVAPDAREVGFGDVLLGRGDRRRSVPRWRVRRVVRPAGRPGHEEPLRTSGRHGPQDHRLEAVRPLSLSDPSTAGHASR